jgi:sodium-dependent dicarboxylate transporter 2/3/5
VLLPIKGQIIDNADTLIRDETRKLGRMSRGEAMVLVVFVTTALLWITRGDVEIGEVTIRGWASRLTGLLGLEQPFVHDATVAMVMGILCFALPVDRKRGTTLLEWEQARQAPWGILLLFGGGFAIAAGFTESGLTQWVGERLVVLRDVPLPVMVAAIALSMTFLTEFTSNTATTTMILPILAATAGVLRVNPLLLMLPATIAASCAFMLPISTPPNAIVFASNRVNLLQMGKTGFWIILIAVAVITALIYFWVVPVLGISPGEAPAWME